MKSSIEYLSKMAVPPNFLPHDERVLKVQRIFAQNIFAPWTQLRNKGRLAVSTTILIVSRLLCIA